MAMHAWPEAGRLATQREQGQALPSNSSGPERWPGHLRGLLIDTWTVIRKDWAEWFAAPGAWSILAIVIAVFGVGVPLAATVLWPTHPWLRWIGVWAPLLLSIGAAADSFAGERERATLEVLLASRLPEQALLLGKIMAVLAYTWGIYLLCLLTSIATLYLTGSGLPAEPGHLLLMALWSGFLVAWTVSLLGVLISARSANVRQAQQLVSLLYLLVFLVATVATLEWVAQLPTADAPPQIILPLAVAGASAGMISVALFIFNLIALAGALLLCRRRKWLVR